VIKSFLGLPKKILEDRLFADYLIRNIYKERLLRSPQPDEVLYWRKLIKVNGIVEFIRQVQLSSEKSALNAKIESQRIIFMHIPKTAGSSFRVFFERFANNVYNFDASENPCPCEKACFITGHFGFSFMKNTTYDHSFTILRDPIERIISLYRYGNSEKSGWESDDPVRILNFAQWISSEDPQVKSLIDSFYIRVITDDLAEPFENRVTSSLTLALERYSHFTHVGDQSNLTPFCKKVALCLDIPFFKMTFDNSARFNTLLYKDYPPRPRLTPKIQTRLHQLTKYDYKVYECFRAK